MLGLGRNHHHILVMAVNSDGLVVVGKREGLDFILKTGGDEAGSALFESFLDEIEAEDVFSLAGSEDFVVSSVEFSGEDGEILGENALNRAELVFIGFKNFADIKDFDGFIKTSGQ